MDAEHAHEPAGASQATIEALIADLSAHEGSRREIARERLIAMGRPAVPALIVLLGDPHQRLRWETAKALSEMRDPAATPALVDAMEDSASSVRWLAAKGLIALGRRALAPLLEGLLRRSDSVWLREGAQHVLHVLVRDGVADEALPVLDALKKGEPAIDVPVAAYHALVALRASEPKQE